MKERILTSLLTVFVISGLSAQQSVVPRLVVGLTVDQLRTDYIEAFSAMYGERGFKRLMKEGRIYVNAEYDFVNIDCSSAVASLYTGTTPYHHGIVGNSWMDRNSLTVVKCVDDRKFMGVYTSESTSPKNLLVSTVSDELMVATQGTAEVYSIGPTREMAVLAAGHAAKGAFWLNDMTGKWCGSTYYGTSPNWVTTYNDRKSIDFRIDKLSWQPFLPVTSYRYITSKVEELTFKHDFTDERDEKYRKFKTSPYVNDEVNRFVNACLDGTSIGKDDIPDLLTISYYAGNYNHKSGSELPMEMQDVYVRLDNSLGDLLDLIDRKVGLSNTLFFITSTGYADSEPVDPAQYRIPSGEFHIDRCAALLNMYLMAIYGPGQYVETYYDNQLYFNHKLIEDRKLNLKEIMNLSSEFLVQMSGVRAAYSADRLLLGSWSPSMEKLRNSFSTASSGDMYIEIMPGWVLHNAYLQTSKVIREAYTSVPLIFMGCNIKPEILYSPINVATVAPTVAHFMRIRAPNAAGTPPLTGICK